ncbi:MAG: hypothetical protein L0H23_04965, partial [Luteimonas sp.]|nr:hypothetical protein [Luteimonas sp.]
EAATPESTSRWHRRPWRSVVGLRFDVLVVAALARPLLARIPREFGEALALLLQRFVVEFLERERCVVAT